MADLRLVEFVLLNSTFAARGATEWSSGDRALGGGYPADEVVQLRVTAERVSDEFVIRIDANLDDDRFPFDLDVSVGARFVVSDADELTAERAQSTLLFMAFPYLRETVWSITGRSPYPAYALPPLTRLPDAPVRGDTPAVIERPLPTQPVQEETLSTGETSTPTSDEDQGNGEQPPETP